MNNKECTSVGKNLLWSPVQKIMLNILSNFTSVNINVHSSKVEILMATCSLGNLRVGDLWVTDRRTNMEESVQCHVRKTVSIYWDLSQFLPRVCHPPIPEQKSKTCISSDTIFKTQLNSQFLSKDFPIKATLMGFPASKCLMYPTV